jgi:hypothetical protein
MNTNRVILQIIPFWPKLLLLFNGSVLTCKLKLQGDSLGSLSLAGSIAGDSIDPVSL